MSGARPDFISRSEAKYEIPEFKDTKPRRLDYTLYPQLAHALYQLLAPIKNPQPALLETTAKKERTVSRENMQMGPEAKLHYIDLINLRCYFDKKAVEGRHVNDPVSIRALVDRSTKGLASSLIIPILFQSTFDFKKIIYIPSQKIFSNINYEHVFNEFWNVLFNPKADVPPIPQLDFNNFFSNLNLDVDKQKWFHGTTKLDLAFLDEAYAVVLRILLLPINTLRKYLEPIYGRDSLVYSILEEQQRDIEVQALLNKDFRKFLFSGGAKKQSFEFIHALTTTPLKGGFTLSAQQQTFTDIVTARVFAISTPESLISYALDEAHLNSEEKETLIKNIIKDLPTNNYSPATILKIMENLKNTLINNRKLSLDCRKEIIKDIMIYKISQQTTVDSVFDIVRQLETDRIFTDVKKRDNTFPFSIKGPGVKTSGSNIECVGARFNAIRRAAKERMCQIAIETNNVESIIDNEDYWQFLITHLDGYWFKWDSLLKYVKNTSSLDRIQAKIKSDAELLDTPPDEEKLDLSNRNPDPIGVYKFVREVMQPIIIEGFKGRIESIKSDIQSKISDVTRLLLWQTPDADAREVELINEYKHRAHGRP